MEILTRKPTLHTHIPFCTMVPFYFGIEGPVRESSPRAFWLCLCCRLIQRPSNSSPPGDYPNSPEALSSRDSLSSQAIWRLIIWRLKSSKNTSSEDSSTQKAFEDSRHQLAFQNSVSSLVPRILLSWIADWAILYLGAGYRLLPTQTFPPISLSDSTKFFSWIYKFNYYVPPTTFLLEVWVYIDFT